jgi:hypothetical protein
VFDPSYQGPFGNTIIVKVNNLCLNNVPTTSGGHNFCGQTVSNPKNEFGESMQCVLTFPIRTWSADIKINRSFDLCDLSGSSQAFFPDGHQAMKGNYQEVPCTSWQGSDGTPIWDGSCMADANAAFWPTPACGNEGMELSPACAVM